MPGFAHARPTDYCRHFRLRESLVLFANFGIGALDMTHPDISRFPVPDVNDLP